MTIERELVRRLAAIAVGGASSRPAAVSTLFAAVTNILLEDLGPEGAISTLERLTEMTRAIFGTGETAQ